MLLTLQEPSQDAVALFLDRRAAETVVENWDRDEPEAAGLHSVQPIEFETSPN